MREDCIECTFEDLLDYEQPTKYIVKSTKYSDDYKTPVLTAGKSFIKGYTNDTTGIFNDLPTIIFDDFTTATQFVDFEFKVKSSAMKILVPTSKLVNMKFVFNCIQVNQVRNDTHKRYWISVYAKKKILLPPLVMQNAIIAKTEEIFSDLDNGIANFKKAQEQLKIYRQAVLKKAFEGELTKEWREKQSNLPTAEELLKQIKEERQKNYIQQVDDWKKAVKEWEKNGSIGKKPLKPKKQTELPRLKDESISELPELPLKWAYDYLAYAGELGRGKSKHRPRNDKNLFGGEYPFFQTGDVKAQKVLKYFTQTYNEVGLKQSKLWKKGTLCITIAANIAETGFLGIDACFPDSIVGFNPFGLIVDARYIDYFFQSAKSKISAFAPATAQKNINLTTLENLVIPFCSIQEQTQIVQEIESRLSVCDKVEQSISESIEKAEALRQSILKKAFEGKLLSNAEIEQCKKSADYEPASELLSKIKAEKLAKEQEKKKKTTVKKKDVTKSKISTDLQAGVISKVIHLHENNPEYLNKLTHVKCEKISHLVEYHLQIPLGRIPVKDAAGPDDYNHLKKVEHRAKMAAYFTVVKQKIGYTYLSNRNITAAITKLESKLTTIQKEQLDRLISLFLKLDLESAEIIATLYAGWNNLLIDGKAPTDDEIVFESRENWSQRKLTIKKERFYKALQWMRKDEIALIPTGYGNKVLKPKNKR